MEGESLMNHVWWLRSMPRQSKAIECRLSMGWIMISCMMNPTEKSLPRQTGISTLVCSLSELANHPCLGLGAFEPRTQTPAEPEALAHHAPAQLLDEVPDLADRGVELHTRVEANPLSRRVWAAPWRMVC